MASDQGKKASTRIEFKHFDIVSDVSDHHYRNCNQSGKDTQCFTNVNGSVNRKIMKEWKILERDLPDSIYVRVYETRIDLLRAVIIGTSGTPYHDGLFFFDIVFPTDYPKHPPKVYYHSHGLRLNPNLYNSGKVCLSLINTWTGTKSEKWTPTKSTILQLLVSIQGLVLNDKPYFNEPGYEVGRTQMSEAWLNKSMAYNEDAFILSCKTMLYNLRKPPKNFESFVTEHFRGRAEFVLAAIKAYRNSSCIVGQYKGGDSSSSSHAKTSAQFKANAGKIYSDLEGAFQKIATTVPAIEKSKIATTAPAINLSKIATTAPAIEKSERQENVTPPKTLAKQSGKRKASTTSKPQATEEKPQRGAWKNIISAVKWIWK